MIDGRWAALGLLTLVSGCASALGPAPIAQSQFSADASCPAARTHVRRIRPAESPQSAPLAEGEVADPAEMPPDVAADPDRAAVWKKVHADREHGSAVAAREYARENRVTSVQVGGCGLVKQYKCVTRPSRYRLREHTECAADEGDEQIDVPGRCKVSGLPSSRPSSTVDLGPDIVLEAGTCTNAS